MQFLRGESEPRRLLLATPHDFILDQQYLPREFTLVASCCSVIIVYYENFSITSFNLSLFQSFCVNLMGSSSGGFHRIKLLIWEVKNIMSWIFKSFLALSRDLMGYIWRHPHIQSLTSRLLIIPSTLILNLRTLASSFCMFRATKSLSSRCKSPSWLSITSSGTSATGRTTLSLSIFILYLVDFKSTSLSCLF